MISIGFKIDRQKSPNHTPFGYHTKESGWSDIFIQFHTIGSIELNAFIASITIVQIRRYFKMYKISFDSHSFLEMSIGASSVPTANNPTQFNRRSFTQKLNLQ